MGVLDKFLDIIKMTDDDDYDDDFYDEDDFEDDDYDEKPKKGLFGGSKKSKKKDLDDFDEELDLDDDKSSKSTKNNVTPMRPVQKRTSKGMEVCVIKPSAVEEQLEIGETLLSGRTVILNLEGLDLEIAQRIIDFTSGTAYAIGGNLQKVSNYIFLVTPNNVGISGDLQDLLNTSFDNASVRTRF